MPKVQLDKKSNDPVDNKQEISSFEGLFNEHLDSIVEEDKEVDILTFVESPYYLNIKTLQPSQRFILKIFYNLPLDNEKRDILLRSFPHDSKGKLVTEQEYATFLINQERTNLQSVTVIERASELLLACGRRGGKTFIASIISAYEAYKLIIKEDPQGQYNMAADEKIKIVNVASTGDQASELATQIQNRIFNCEWFLPYIASFNADTINLKTKLDIKKMKTEEEQYGQPLKKRATIKIEAMLCSARGSRGGSVIVVIFDELAHFIDNAGNRGGKAVYDGLTPSGATFGKDSKIICISSPYTKSGIFYDLCLDAQTDQSIRFLQMPTWEMNTLIDFEWLQGRYKKDNESFWTEYGAQFSTTITGFFKFPERIYDCVDILRYDDTIDDEGQPKKVPVYRPETITPANRYLHYLALDPAESANGYALALVHCETRENGIVVVVDKWKKWDVDDPEFSAFDFIDIEMIDNYVMELTRQFRIAKIVYDQFSSGASIQKFRKAGMDAVKTHFSRQYNMKIYRNLRSIIYDKKLSIIYKEDGLKELAYLQEKKVGKKQFIVQAPNSGDVTSDDLADVLANASYVAVQQEVSRPSASITGTSLTDIRYKQQATTATVERSRMRKKVQNNALMTRISMARRMGIHR